MLKIGVLGAGHLGKIHIKLLKGLPEFELIGFYDPDDTKCAAASEEYGVKSFTSLDELVDSVDAVDIVTPTLSHFECAVTAIKKFKHVFIEKPMTNTMEEAASLMRLAEEADVKVQVGHVERFNPAFVSAEPHLEQPMFIETHRLAEFNPRGTDVSVILDLMIHDIDIILSVVRSSIKKISASGVAVVSDTPDIANARIEFTNGCVANLTASRMSMKNMRKSRFFQQNAYISVDFLEKKVEVIKMKDVIGEPDPFALTVDLGEDKGSKEIYFNKPNIEESNAIGEELASFARAINDNSQPIVTISDGYDAMDLAYKIIDRLALQGKMEQNV